MTQQTPLIQFFEGLSEGISDVSLRLNRSSGTRIVLFTFDKLNAIERFNSYTKRFSNSMCLKDAEGEIQIEPDSMQFIFGGPEGDDLKRVECKFEINREDHWQRFMRFMNRYAEANGMVYGEPGQG